MRVCTVSAKFELKLSFIVRLYSSKFDFHLLVLITGHTLHTLIERLKNN